MWTFLQKKMYIFLKHTLEHWPLDASFRLFMETWLSYIQPWRYIPNKSRNSDGDKVVDFKWQNFVAENLLYYSLFLEKVILRFVRLDLSSSKTALMLYRISKVSPIQSEHNQQLLNIIYDFTGVFAEES